MDQSISSTLTFFCLLCCFSTSFVSSSVGSLILNKKYGIVDAKGSTWESGNGSCP